MVRCLSEGFPVISEEKTTISEEFPTTFRRCSEDFRRVSDDDPRGCRRFPKMFRRFPEGFRRCSEDFPRGSRRCTEGFPRGPRGVVGRRRLFGAFGEKQGTSWKGQECRGAPLPVQGLYFSCVVVLFDTLLWQLMLFFMQIFFRLSDWSRAVTWAKCRSLIGCAMY